MLLKTDTRYEKDKDKNGGNLQLREERIDISKKWTQTSEVTMHKDIITEDKTITVPVERVELVIDIVPLGDGDSVKKETIRIPISEEEIEINKHPILLEEVSYYINEYKNNEVIVETLKKEKLKIDTEGKVDIAYNK